MSQRQSLALTEVTTHTQGTPFSSQGAPFSSLSTSSFASGGIEAQITCSSICCLEGHQIITLPWMCLETGNTPFAGFECTELALNASGKRQAQGAADGKGRAPLGSWNVTPCLLQKGKGRSPWLYRTGFAPGICQFSPILYFMRDVADSVCCYLLGWLSGWRGRRLDLHLVCSRT